MAGKNIPTVSEGSPNHPTIHNDLKDVVNMWDYDAFAALPDGYHGAFGKQGGLLVPEADIQGGGGFGQNMGIQFCHPSGNNTNDGLSPATAKATPQACVTALPSNGGKVIFPALGTFYMISSTISDQGKTVHFQGQGSATRLRFSSAFGPMFHLTNRWSGVEGFEINCPGTLTSSPGIGGILMHEKNTWISRVSLWNIGSTCNTAFAPGNASAPYGIKVISPATTESTYPTLNGTELSDWIYIDHVYFFHTYRGLVMLGGMNAAVTHLMGEAGEKGAAIYIERGDAFLNSSAIFGSSHLVIAPDGHLVGNPDAGYLVDINKIGSLDFSQIRFVGFRFESFDNGPAHIRTRLSGLLVDGCTFGGVGNQNAEIEFVGAANSADSRVGTNLYTRAGGPVFVGGSNVKYAQHGTAAGH